MIQKPKKGQAVWMIVNGRPARRYFLRGEKYVVGKEWHWQNCVVAFAKDDKDGVYSGYPVFYESKQEALLAMLEGAIENLRHYADQSMSLLRQIKESDVRD